MMPFRIPRTCQTNALSVVNDHSLLGIPLQYHPPLYTRLETRNKELNSRASVLVSKTINAKGSQQRLKGVKTWQVWSVFYDAFIALLF